MILISGLQVLRTMHQFLGAAPSLGIFTTPPSLSPTHFSTEGLFPPEL